MVKTLTVGVNIEICTSKSILTEDHLFCKKNERFLQTYYTGLKVPNLWHGQLCDSKLLCSGKADRLLRYVQEKNHERSLLKYLL